MAVFERARIAANVIAARLEDARVGIVAKGLDVDPYEVTELVAQHSIEEIDGPTDDANHQLYIAIVGYPPVNTSFTTDVVVSDMIEDAVAWRSIPEYAGRILVFVRGDVAKLHSLEDFDEFSTRDLTKHLVDEALHKNLATTTPQKRFWHALQDEAASFPLRMVEEFVEAVATDKSNPEAISINLWCLGLLRDDALLDSHQNVSRRLLRNRELIEEMGQLSVQSRRRIGTVLLKATGDDRERLRKALSGLQDFFRRGDKKILKDLDHDTIEQLIRSGRPLPSPPEPEDENGNNDDNGDEPPRRVLQGKKLEQAVAELAVSDDSDEATESFHQLGEFIRRQINDSDFDENDISIEQGFEGHLLRPTTPNNEIIQFIGLFCGEDRWGGILTTDKPNLKAAINRANPGEAKPYNPDAPEPHFNDRSLFDIIRGFDEHLAIENALSKSLDRMISARGKLLQHIELLLGDASHPLILFRGYSEAREALDDYLDAYAQLLRDFKQQQGALHDLNPFATRFVAAELLRLDIVHVRTPGEWKAILTPLHPLHLWRYREVFSTLQKGKRNLSEEDLQQLSRALPDLPHLLHFVILSPDVTGSEETVLPRSGSIGLLPTYENRTNRYLGHDGIDFLKTLLGRWLKGAPYTRSQIRVALVDAPELDYILNLCAQFLAKHKDAKLILDSYYTHEQNPVGELAQLDFEEKDHVVTELMRSGELLARLHSHESLEQVVADIQKQPVHIAYLFDQSEYQIDNAPRAKHLVVSPLIVTYQYMYDESVKQGLIGPSSDADEGIFADYNFLAQLSTSVSAGRQLQMKHNPAIDLKPADILLESDAVRWLVVADRTSTVYVPEGAIPLDERQAGQREIAVWQRTSSRAVKGIIKTLSHPHNLQPQVDVVVDLIQRYGHIAADGFLKASVSRGEDMKSFIGTLLAAAWYTRRYPDALVASLDSDLAKQWLDKRPSSAERADLVGVRMDPDNSKRLIIEPIEVKTRKENVGVSVDKNSETKEKHLSGKAVDQIKAVLDTILPIFGGRDPQPLLTPARREALKFQLHRECFRKSHGPDWTKRWYLRLRDVFSEPPKMDVFCRGVILHVHLESSTDVYEETDNEQQIDFIEIGRKAIQPLLQSSEDNGSDDSDEPPTSPPFSPPPDVQDDSPTEGDVKSASPDTPRSDEDEASVAEAMADQLLAKEQVTAPVKVDLATEEVSEAETSVNSKSTPAEVAELSRLFLRASQAFRIQIDKCDPERAVIGPNVLRFYVKLARGQKIDALRGTLEDIGREMRRPGLTVSTLPYSNEIALDVPRLDREIVYIDRALALIPEIESPEQMPIPIGVTPEGEDLIVDLGTLPHILVGGTTGAGKTVFLYGILAALLKTHPNPKSLRLLISSSKPEDFSFFAGLPHLETGKVIFDAEVAIDLLQTHVTNAFNERLKTLTQAHCRDIFQYNSQQPSSPIPPLVVIVDEFADLADQLANDRSAQKSFYTQLRRIAQLGRSRGVHLILCTQRPSADLVPTNIRTLMNARVALRVNDAIASRMILDEPGAEQLQKKGDLLFKEESGLRRMQGFFVPTATLHEILESLKRTDEP